MLNRIDSTICIEASIRKQLIKVICYLLICLFGTLLFTGVVKEQVPQVKLAFGQILSVIFFVFTLYELFRLCFLKQNKLIISDVYLSWKRGHEQQDIRWELVSSINIFPPKNNSLFSGHTYEFNNKSSKENALTVTSVLDITDYRVDCDEFYSIIRMKSKDYEFGINTIER